MSDDEELLTGKRRGRGLAIGMLLLFAACVVGATGFYIYHSRQKQERQVALVEQVTGAAFGCVASVRGDSPESWGLENALEHMSRMERVTRDADDAEIAEERARFTALATDAAAGCQELGELMREAHREEADLYFGVPAVLAQVPDQTNPEHWFRRILPKSRTEVVELTRQIQSMAEAINERRAEQSLMAQELPVSGRDANALARIIELAPIPPDKEQQRTEVWPMPEAILVVRRGSLPHVRCESTYVTFLSCYSDYVQTVSWDGEVSAQRELERPSRVQYWASFAPGTDGSIWAVGIDRHNDGVVGRYAPGDTVPEVESLHTEVDGTTNLVPVARGVAVFPSDGSAWFSPSDHIAFETVELTPPPIVVTTGSGGPDRGIELEHIGAFSMFGSEEDGFSSRLARSEGEDILLRVVDANVRVRSVASLRALSSGKAVALFQRHAPSPDAIAITHDFGASWLP